MMTKTEESPKIKVEKYIPIIETREEREARQAEVIRDLISIGVLSDAM